MSEPKDTTLSELEEATKESEPKSEGTDTKDSSSAGEQPKETDSIEKLVESKPKQIDHAKQQEETWVKKIAEDTSGEVYQQFKDNKSLWWLHDRVESKLGIKEAAPSESFEEKMAQYEAERKRKELLDKVKTLPTDQRQEIKQKVEKMVNELGADPTKALTTAMKDIQSETPPPEVVTTGHSGKSNNTITLDELSALEQDKYVAMKQKIAKGEISLIQN